MLQIHSYIADYVLDTFIDGKKVNLRDENIKRIIQ